MIAQVAIVTAGKKNEPVFEDEAMSARLGQLSGLAIVLVTE